jgi:hypothetical protein
MVKAYMDQATVLKNYSKAPGCGSEKSSKGFYQILRYEIDNIKEDMKKNNLKQIPTKRFYTIVVLLAGDKYVFFSLLFTSLSFLLSRFSSCSRLLFSSFFRCFVFSNLRLLRFLRPLLPLLPQL